jgi:hypothetical protein
VRFGEYLIRTWYYSPYPTPLEVAGTSGSASALADPKGGRGRKRKEAPGEVPALSAGVRVGPRSANDVFTGGVGKEGEGSMGRLWVCDVS